MKPVITIRIVDVIGGSLCISTEDGQAVYEKLAPLLREGQRVSLSFAGVDTLISAFLNAAIGQLFGEFSEERINELLAVDDLDLEDQALLERVKENAKVYFKNPRRFDEAWKSEVGDEE